VAANVAHLVSMKLWRTLKRWRKEAPAVGSPPEFRLETWYRLKGWQKLLLVILCVLAYVLCVGPTFSSNVLPHMLASLNPDGSLNGGEIVSSIYLIGAVILLTTAPLLIPHVAWHQAIGLVIMSLFIVYVNINNACGTIGHTRDVKADEPRQKIERIHRLDAKIEQLTKAFEQVPAHKFVTEGLVKAAEKAAHELEKSAADECGSGAIWSRTWPQVRCAGKEAGREA
jgi:hypothetical protein